MPLENIGAEGSINTHWKSTVIENEYMNASVSNTQAYYSGFTANLLRDTGFYDEINESMVEKIFYGQGVGCQHITGQCDSNRREYCEPEIDDELCDYYHLGASECSKGQYNEHNCNTFEIYEDSKCWNIKSDRNTKDNQEKLGVQFGINSRCFNNSILKEKSQQQKIIITGECYQYECKSNGQQVTIQVGKTKVTCTQNLQRLKVKGYSGELICPDNITQFCGFKKFCPNFCNSNGYCINNKCYCAKNYFGNDCNINIPLPKK
ncbi:leishmanolysin family protein, putative [Ichthyophthirius multifiliis]|uniref:Leishmanolysin family protein, putative n=1 Tax=Ichthyophthirius multifiliis TaxID=5932 RepID=G0QLB4_ICHMU|nr:leishmanolysin family protein, putative [Ichthyophthirius multifiliis]EGR33988.1 leishmanolysin family protein, putative [Ichthyophthirius multifiliis]|eukprot:XP_004039292.1 leishmanolysin family protein, putative [Ichthyophthirius multifiliis]